MPKITSGNLEYHVLMIAEKAADMIKKTVKCSHRDQTFGVNSHNPIDPHWPSRVTEWETDLPKTSKYSDQPKTGWNSFEDVLAEY